MRIQLKPILPKRKILDVIAVERGIEDALNDAAAFAQELYEKTTATWETDVTFTIRKTKYGRSIGTRSTIYTYVDRGTKPHDIRPKRADALAFQYGEARRAKTKPRVISSYKGSPGDQWARKQVVHHPGTEARGFTVEISERANQRLRGNLRRNLSRSRIG
ncbi:MAG TPA: hypothetical protein PL187_09545 [Caldilinea sp.]|nr:hypothetical protein [Caldilinea sp.]